MPSTDYLWEKILVAVNCLASGEGSFESRLFDAYVSALMRLDLNDPPASHAGELEWIIQLCEQHHTSAGMSSVSESDRRKVVEKLIHILIETSRHRA